MDILEQYYNISKDERRDTTILTEEVWATTIVGTSS